MNEGDRLKRILVLCLVILMMAGCAKEEKTVKRAVFAWEGVEEADEQLLENYRIDTIFMDINHYSSIPGYKAGWWGQAPLNFYKIINLDIRTIEIVY